MQHLRRAGGETYETAEDLQQQSDTASASLVELVRSRLKEANRCPRGSMLAKDAAPDMCVLMNGVHFWMIFKNLR